MASIDEHADSVGMGEPNEVSIPVLTELLRQLRSMPPAEASWFKSAVLEGSPIPRPTSLRLYSNDLDEITERLTEEIVNQEFRSSVRGALRVFEVRVSGRYGVDQRMSVMADDRDDAVERATSFLARFNLRAS